MAIKETIIHQSYFIEASHYYSSQDPITIRDQCHMIFHLSSRFSSQKYGPNTPACTAHVISPDVAEREGPWIAYWSRPYIWCARSNNSYNTPIPTSPLSPCVNVFLKKFRNN